MQSHRLTRPTSRATRCKHYQVLNANQDPRAPEILSEAYDLMQKRAANISDEELRFCFLNNLAANREIVSEYEISGLGETQ